MSQGNPASPNVVLIFTDDQRFDTIHALGNEHVQTPNMDRLCRMGTAFTHAHIPGGTCGAVCMPSRAMLHTGRTLFHLDGEGQSIPPEHKTMGERFREAGYASFGTGKWHNGAAAYARSFTHGGEIFFGGMWDHWNVPAYNFDPTGTYDNWNRWIQDPWAGKKERAVQADHISLGKHSTELFTDCALDFLKSQPESKENPYFMYVSYMAPHDPRTMPEEFLKLYDGIDLPLPENFQEEHPFNYGVRTIRDEKLAPYPRTEADTKQQLREYYAIISHLDHHIGRLIDAVEERGELENTIFVLAGDNGLAVGQHGLFGKQSNYEHSVRVPLIFAGPGIAADQRSDAFTYLLDIFPTLCDLCGLEAPASIEGESQAHILRGQPGTGRESLFFAYTDLVRAVKDRRYKYIEYRYEGQVWKQLFDLENDPSECVDLASRPDHEGHCNRLQATLREWKDLWEDEGHHCSQSYWKTGD